MNIKVNRKTNIDYDKILDGVVWIFYFAHSGIIKLRCGDLRDRQEVDDNKYPIYKGRFGNALIALNNAKITNKLYLIDNKNFELIKNRYTKTITVEELEKCATHTIERKEV